MDKIYSNNKRRLNQVLVLIIQTFQIHNLIKILKIWTIQSKTIINRVLIILIKKEKVTASYQSH